MTDLTTNPTVLEALEIAPIELEDKDGIAVWLCVVEGMVVLEMRCSSATVPKHQVPATAADLDHAIPVWMTFLAKAGGSAHLEVLNNSTALVNTTVNGTMIMEGCVDADEPIIVVSLAKAVVKVGQPLEEKEDG